MTANPLTELAERVQALTSACREMDRAIYETALLDAEMKRLGANSWFCAVNGSSFGFNIDSNPDGQKTRWCGPIPCFTASRDAAVALRLDWMSIETCESAAPASSSELQFTECRIWDWRCGPFAIDGTSEWKVKGNRPLPLNMCAAILRARAASENSHG